MNISSTIKSIQDIMRKDDGVDGDAQRIGQLTWMLFLKVFDQSEDDWEDDAKIAGKPYQSPIPDEFRWRNWAAMKEGKHQLSAEAVKTHVERMMAELRELTVTDDPKTGVIRQIFEDANNYMKSGTLILGVIEKLETIDFHSFTTRAQLGTVYEQVLNDLRSAGNAGEFYTPRAITHFMVERLSPRLDIGETVLDPACGTGGFLTAAIEEFQKQQDEYPELKKTRNIEDLIFGFEKKQLPHLLCLTNLVLHRIEVPKNVRRINTLAKNWSEWGIEDHHNCIVSNPPFGGMEEDGVGSGYPPDVRTRETADMFMTLISRKLMGPGSRAAVVLPDGFMFGDGIKAKTKKWLLEHCNLHTVIRLPKGVFAPYTSIKTNLLFFTKGKPTETIWFYEHPYPAGYKSYSKTKPIDLKEFKAEQDWWGSEESGFAERVESELAWKVDFKTKKREAEAAAQPHWDKAEELGKQAGWHESRARFLRDALVGQSETTLQTALQDIAIDLAKDINELSQKAPVSEADTRQIDHLEALAAALEAALLAPPSETRKAVETQVQRLRQQAESLKQQSRTAQTAGDRLYWPIYNLDIRNPNTAAEETHDPDLLLEKYKKLLGEIEDTQNQLKGELAAVLAHHFSPEAKA